MLEHGQNLKTYSKQNKRHEKTDIVLSYSYEVLRVVKFIERQEVEW